jgi:hypothetical protein
MKRVAVVAAGCLIVSFAYLLITWRVRERRVAAFDAAAVVAVWQLEPRLAEFPATVRLAPPARRDCVSPFPASFPVCQRDGEKILLLHAASPDADEMHPLHGLLYDPSQENVSHAGSWYVGRLLEPLGHGWYHVRAYPGLD